MSVRDPAGLKILLHRQTDLDWLRRTYLSLFPRREKWWQCWLLWRGFGERVERLAQLVRCTARNAWDQLRKTERQLQELFQAES